MTYDIIIQYIITAIIVLGFVLSIGYVVTHNPNYTWREILQKPWLIFKIAKEAKDILDDKLADIKNEAEQTIEDIKDIKETAEEAVEVVSSFKEVIEKAKDELTSIAAENEQQPKENNQNMKIDN